MPICGSNSIICLPTPCIHRANLLISSIFIFSIILSLILSHLSVTKCSKSSRSSVAPTKAGRTLCATTSPSMSASSNFRKHSDGECFLKQNDLNWSRFDYISTYLQTWQGALLDDRPSSRVHV